MPNYKHIIEGTGKEIQRSTDNMPQTRDNATQLAIQYKSGVATFQMGSFGALGNWKQVGLIQYRFGVTSPMGYLEEKPVRQEKVRKEPAPQYTPTWKKEESAPSKSWDLPKTDNWLVTFGYLLGLVIWGLVKLLIWVSPYVWAAVKWTTPRVWSASKWTARKSLAYWKHA